MTIKRLCFFALLALTSLGLLGAGGLFALYLWVSKDLPSITKVSDYRPPQVTTVYARDGSIMGYFFREKRFLVNIEQMPRHLPLAFLAAEDARFFDHPGFDLKAIIRAFITNLQAGAPKGGASTITQQVIKRLLLTPERSYERKLKEIILAYRLEKYLTKEQILYIYLNQIYLGNSSYGVEAAARTYFAKHVEDLSLAESAVLAGLPKAPSRNNPYAEPENIKERQEWVLDRMLDVGFISQAEHAEAKAQALVYHSMPDPSWSVGSWYLEEVRRQLLAYFTEENVRNKKIALDMTTHDPGRSAEERAKIPYEERVVYEAGLHVYTVMDPVHQRAAEIALRAGLHDACKRRGWRGPLEKLTPDAFASFLRNTAFTPQALENANWVKGLVTAVTRAGAEVALGEEHKGFIDVKTMGWARTPNTNISPEAAGRVTDAAKVLAVGDVVWVSAVGATGTANPVSQPFLPTDKNGPARAYSAADITPEILIPLCLEQLPDLQGAVASIDVEAGDLVAIAGGYAFSPESQFNRATQAKRQPGSSFKPIVYSTALDNGLTAGTILLDAPFVLPASSSSKLWRPGNFDGKFLGPVLLRTALAKSRNLCTVRVAQQIGMPAIVERARQLGIPGDIPAVLAVSLGSYEATPQNMAEAYTAFANHGLRIKPRIIREVQDCWQNRLVSFDPDIQEAISPQNAYIMSYLLKEVVNAGTATRARVLGRPVAGKTGTSNDERDAWFIGFSPYLVTSVYVGYDNNAPMGRMETGGRAALPIFIRYRQQVDPLYPPTDFPIPPGISFALVDANTGYLAGAGSTETYSLPFMPGTTPHLVTGQPLERGDDDVRVVEEWMKQVY
jgi:penicillin-binding protein 1A